MERCIVVYDVVNDQTGFHVQTVKLYNDSLKAADEVLDYCNNFRSDRYWSKTVKQEILDQTSANAFAALYGYLTPTPMEGDLPEIITMYKIEAEDPENDPIKVILQDVVDRIDPELKNHPELSETDIHELMSNKEFLSDMLDMINKKEDEHRGRRT